MTDFTETINDYKINLLRRTKVSSKKLIFRDYSDTIEKSRTIVSYKMLKLKRKNNKHKNQIINVKVQI